MPSWPSLLTLAHLIGLVLGVGAASVKLMLLLKCRADARFVPSYLTIVGSVTRLILVGLALLTLSGIGWLLIGYGITARLVVKIVMVLAIWAVGPVIDKVVEPEFRALAPSPGEAASPAFLQAQRRYLLVETIATGLFWVIVVFWVLV